MYDEFVKAEGGGSRAYLGGLEGVVWCEGDVQEEDPSLVDGAGGAQDGGPPLIDVISFWTRTESTQTRTIQTLFNYNTGRNLVIEWLNDTMAYILLETRIARPFCRFVFLLQNQFSMARTFEMEVLKSS